MMPTTRLTAAEVESFAERLLPLLRGRIHGVTLIRLARVLETPDDPSETIYHRIRTWLRSDRRDNHGIGFWRSGPQAPFIVYLQAEPFEPPVPGERLVCADCQTRVAEKNRRICSTCRHRHATELRQRTHRNEREELKHETSGVPAVNRNHYQRPRVPVRHCPVCCGQSWRRLGRCPGCDGMPEAERVEKDYAPSGVQWAF